LELVVDVVVCKCEILELVFAGLVLDLGLLKKRNEFGLTREHVLKKVLKKGLVYFAACDGGSDGVELIIAGTMCVKLCAKAAVWLKSYGYGHGREAPEVTASWFLLSGDTRTVQSRVIRSF
jgi:hypothetical protein